MSQAVAMPQYIDNSALVATLKLAVGESAEMVDIDPVTGDYRVFYCGLEATPKGGKSLTFELYRQGPGFELTIFNVLSLALGPLNANGLCQVEDFFCDAGANVYDLPRLLHDLAQIVAVLQEKRRPEDVLLLPFLSKPSRTLWTQTLVKGNAA